MVGGFASNRHFKEFRKGLDNVSGIFKPADKDTAETTYCQVSSQREQIKHHTSGREGNVGAGFHSMYVL